MKSRRIFLLMSAVIVLLVVSGIAAVVFGNVSLSKQAKELLNIRLEDRIIEEQQTALVAASKEIEQYSDLEKIAKAIVPQDKDQAQSILEINKIAQASGIKLKNINFQTSNLGLPTTKPSVEEGSDSAPAAPTVAPLSQVKAVEGIPGVYSLEITISPLDNQVISYNRFLDFLERLEKNRRTAHVDKIIVTPLPPNNLSFSLTLNVYVKP